MQAHRRWLLAVTLAVLGCESEQIPFSKISILMDRFGRSSEPTSAPEALTLHEVSFMVRMHFPETEIMDAVQKRGLAEALDEPAARALAEVGAKPGLIEALKTSQHVLTEGEQALYRDRKEKRDAAATAARRAQEDWQRSNTATVNSQVASREREVRDRRIQELTTEINQNTNSHWRRSKLPMRKSRGWKRKRLTLPSSD